MSDPIYNLILSGNQDGLSMLLDKYGGLMAYIAGNIGNFNEDDLSECISDALLAIWKRIGNYKKDKSSFKSWIILVTRGCAIDYLRKVSRHDRVTYLEDIKEEFGLNEDYDSLDTGKLCKLMSKLSPPDNEIFYRRFILGENVFIISKVLNITKDNIYKRISRGREKLRAILIEEGYYV
jgi:RNA polymerase sigma-70 factor, ECF subfamily